METNKKIAIVGATSSIAEHCARLWLEGGSTDLVLIGRDLNRLKRVADDLKVRSPTTNISTIETDLLNPESIKKTTDAVTKKYDVNFVLIAHGMLPVQSNCQMNILQCQNAIEINGVSPVLWAEAFAYHFEKVNKGTIAIIGSVAGDRGRSSNYVYGSAKSLVETYAKGMQHRFYKSGVKVILIKPGPTDTPMTFGLRERVNSLASVSDVASSIVNGIRIERPVIYAPRKWQLIMFIIRHLPRFLFNRMKI